MKTLRRKIVLFVTRHLEFNFLRRLYIRYSAVLNWWKYGDPNFPRMCSIEISSHCNRACTYCPNVVAPQKPRLIKEEVFQKVIARLAEIDYSGVLDFIFFNEPTLHPRLADLVAYAKKHLPKCIPRICTNGDLLNEERVRKYHTAGLDRIYVMRHLPYQEGWQENIDKLDAMFPGLFVKMDIRNLEAGDGLNNFGGVVEVKKVLLGERNGDGTNSCRVHAHVLQVTIDGDWDLCCTDFSKSHQFGNICARPIMEIWNDPAFVAMRKSLRAGKPILPVCKGCFIFHDYNQEKPPTVSEALAVAGIGGEGKNENQ